MNKIEPISIQVMDCTGIDEIFVRGKRLVSSEFEEDLGQPIFPGQNITFFSNLKEHYDQSGEEDFNTNKYLSPYYEIIECIESNSKSTSVDQFLINTLNELECISKEFTDVIVIDTINSHAKKKFTSISKAKKHLIDHFNTLIWTSQTYAELVYTANNKPDRKFLYPLAFNVFGGFREDIKYGAIMGKKGDADVVIDMYLIGSSRSVLDFEFISIIKNNTNIKICENCNRYFIPVSRSDEIYCNFVNESGRSCKDVGFENKIKKDSILKSYRTIYKTQNARKQRNLHLPNIESKFNKWTEYAKKQLEECKSGVISIDQMKANISKDDWLSNLLIKNYE